MKKINKLMNSDWLQRLAVLVVGLICVVGNVRAEEHTYYYQATVSVSPSGSGKVYVTTQESSSYNESLYQGTMTISGSKDKQQGPYLQTLVFKALDPQNDSDPSNDGWKFDYWTINGTKIQNTALSNTNTYEIRSENESNPTTITAVANYTQIAGWVKVRVAGNEGGSVSISKANNVRNDNITISATAASDSYTFLGWNTSENDVTNFVFTDAEVSLTVSTAVTYYAHFAKATPEYCTLKNVSTGKYLSLYGDYSATHPDNTYVFTNSLKTIFDAEANNNPLIVFKRVTNSGTGYLSTDLSNGSGVITTNTLIGKYTPLTFSSQGNGIYRISATIDDVTYYLCDNGSEFVSLQSSNTKDIDWEITIMSEETGFGINANAKYTRGGKYYTSLYAPFAYKLGEGVNAYYFDLNADNYDETTNTLTLSEISSGNVVPENMAVIIECSTANDPANNQLLPVDKYTISDDLQTKYNENILIGYNQIDCQEDITKYRDVSNNKDYMYVFSIKNNNLGFYHYNGNTIPKNKAYLKLSVTLEELADYLSDNPNPIKLAFGSQFDDDLLNSIRLSNEEADDTDLPIYNLQGVQVKNPEKGIYIRGGKKYLVK